MIDKKTLEGIITTEDADTSTAELDPETEAGLNNATVPTPEEEENANIVDETAPNADTDIEGETTVIVNDTQEEPAPVEEPGLNSEQPNSIDPELGLAEASATKTFTQSQVDEIAGKTRKETREKVTRDFFSRYGVNTMDELDDLVGDAQRFLTSQDDFAEKEKVWKETDDLRNKELTEVKERVALLESGIDRDRFEDAKLILRGKGLEVTADNIASELATHPEWKKQDIAPTPVEEAGLPFKKNNGAATKIEIPNIPTLGNNGDDNPQPELSERERAMKMFKV